MADRFETDTDALGNLLVVVNERLVPEGSFKTQLTEVLSSIKEKGLRALIEVCVPSGAGVAQYGESSDGEPLLRSSSNGQTGVVDTRVSWWLDDATTGGASRAAAHKLTDTVFQIIKAHWGDRDQLSLLPRATSGSNKNRFEKALAQQCRETGVATGAFLDLDEFKKVNTDYSYEIGSAVIGEFAQRLRWSFGDDSIIIHQGGDEFVLVVLDEQPSNALYRLNQFRQRVAAKPFQELDRSITCTIAVVGYPDLGVDDIGADGWVGAFLSAFQSVTASKPDRNMLLFPSVEQATMVPRLQHSDLAKVALLARAEAVGPRAWPYAFDSAAIRALEDDLTNCKLDSLAPIVAEHSRSMNLHVGVTLRSGETAANRALSPAVRQAAIVLASCLRSAYRGGQCLASGSQLYLGPSETRSVLELRICHAEDKPLATVPLMVDVEFDNDVSQVAAGPVWVREPVADGVGIVRPGDELGRLTSPYAVIEVGDDRVDAAVAAASATVIRVDSRPVTGGGLPDFWQSNVARVITAALENPGIGTILLSGDRAHVQQTLRFLDERNHRVPVERGLASRLGLEEADLGAFGARRIRIVSVPSGKNDDALEAALAILNSAGEAKPRSQQIGEARQRARRIQLPEPTSGALGIWDGLRLRTLADAYPTVIQLLRTQKEAAQRDRSDRRFVELPAFKLTLEQPESDMIPEFWSDAAGRLELKSYYQRVFEARDGLFGARLRGWSALKGDSAGIDQIAQAEEAIARARVENFADRRILLTVGSPTIDRSSPLGLTAVHLLPRTVDSKWQVDAVWVWRSVEALVGFPFSAYGAIQQSVRVIESVNTRLAKTRHSPISLGSVTYLALSLHMYVGDDGDDEIARAVLVGALA